MPKRDDDIYVAPPILPSANAPSIGHAPIVRKPRHPKSEVSLPASRGRKRPASNISTKDDSDANTEPRRPTCANNQMWRFTLYGDEQQVLEQLEKLRNWILNGRKDAAPKNIIIETTSQLGTASQPTTTAPTTQPPAAASSTTQPTTTATAAPAKEPTPPTSVGARLPPPPPSEQQQDQQQQPASGGDAGGGVDVDAVAAAAVAAVAGAVAQQGQDGAQPMQTDS